MYYVLLRFLLIIMEYESNAKNAQKISSIRRSTPVSPLTSYYFFKVINQSSFSPFSTRPLEFLTLDRHSASAAYLVYLKEYQRQVCLLMAKFIFILS